LLENQNQRVKMSQVESQDDTKYPITSRKGRWNVGYNAARHDYWGLNISGTESREQKKKEQNP
jgi:hypothetical protein